MSEKCTSDYEVINCEFQLTCFKIGDNPRTSRFFQLTKNVTDGSVQLSCSFGKYPGRLTRLDVDVIKTCPKPAMATIKLQLSDMNCCIKNINNWKKKYQFHALPFEYDSQRCMIRGSCSESHKDVTSHIFSINIKCQIIWYGFFQDYYSTNLPICYTLYSSEMDFCDMKIKVEDKYYAAHRLVVGSRSSVLKKTLMVNMKESQQNCIDLTDLGADVVEELLLFIYESRIDKAEDDEDLLLKLLKVGEMYDIPGLKNYCGMLLSNKLTEDNVLMLLEAGHIHNLSILRTRAIAYIVVNKKEILDGSDFKDLSLRHPELCFEICLTMKFFLSSLLFSVKIII